MITQIFVMPITSRMKHSYPISERNFAFSLTERIPNYGVWSKKGVKFLIPLKNFDSKQELSK